MHHPEEPQIPYKTYTIIKTLCPIFFFFFHTKWWRKSSKFQMVKCEWKSEANSHKSSQISNLNINFHYDYTETSDPTGEHIYPHILRWTIATKLERQEFTWKILFIVLKIYLLSYSSSYNSHVQKNSVKIPQKVWRLLQLSFMNILLCTLPSGAMHH